MPKTFLVPVARIFDAASNKSTKVMLPGAKLTPDAVHYDEQVHKGKLLCGACDATVHFQHLIPVVLGGMLPPRREHFHTNPKQVHQNCRFKDAEVEARTPRVYDTERGYRIHLNISPARDHFNAQSLVHSDANGRIVAHDPDLFNREPRTIHTVRDLIDLIEEGHYARLRDSVVIHQGYDPIPWNQFFIRYDRNARGREPVAGPRFANLTASLLDRAHRSAFPVLMEMRFHKPVEPQEGYTTARGLSRAMFWEKARDWGKSHHIQPRVILANLANESVAGAVKESGVYLVLGHARLKTEMERGHVTHFLDVKVHKPEQIAKKDVAEIVATPQLPLMPKVTQLALS